MGKPVEEIFRRDQFDVAHRTLHPRLDLCLVLRGLLNTDRLGDDLLDRHARIERLERILKDDLHHPTQILQILPSVEVLLNLLEMHIAEVTVAGIGLGTGVGNVLG